MNEHEDKVLGYILIAGLILGIIAAVILVIISRQPPEPFSAVYFTNPDDLPNLVRIGNTYAFDYAIQSHENETREYDITTKLELFRLYDTTEGLYNCLSPYRHKIYLKWTNETNLTHATIQDELELIPDLRIEPDHSNTINWNSYYFSADLGNAYGEGEFIIFFANENYTKYKISINQKENQSYFNDEAIGKINMSNQNDKIRIEYKNQELEFYYNNKLITRKKIEDATNGQFGFETRDTFVTLGGAKISRDQEIEVPDREHIWEYQIDTNLYYNLLGLARQNENKEILMVRNFISAETFQPLPGLRTETPAETDEEGNIIPIPSGISCYNEFACKYQSTNENNYQIELNNITSLLYSLPRINYGNSFWLTPRTQEDKYIIWNNFDVNVNLQSFTGQDSMAVKFDEDFAVLITTNTFSAIIRTDKGIIIQQKPKNLQKYNDSNNILNENFTIKIRGSEVELIFGNDSLIVETNKDFNNSSIDLFHHNTFSSITKIEIKDSSEECNDSKYKFCKLTYKFQQPTPRQSEQNPTDFGTIKQEQIITDTEKILSRTLEFSGVATRIINKTNITFNANFIYLDGDGVIDFVYKDLDGNEKARVSVNMENNAIELNGTRQKTINQVLQKDAWHEITLKLLQDGWINVMHNRTDLGLMPTGTNTGYFSIEQKNTYAEFRQVSIRDDVTGRTTNIPLLDDPCQLRLVYSKTIRQENFTLEPETRKEYKEFFKLNEFFDYGKVSITMNGSSNTNNTALGIHFWMVRT